MVSRSKTQAAAKTATSSRIPVEKPAAAETPKPDVRSRKPSESSRKAFAAPVGTPSGIPKAAGRSFDRLSTPKARISKHDLRGLQQALFTERSRLSSVVEGLRNESLVRHDEVNHEEDGTDAFIRLSGLDRASSEQSQVIKIDEALRAIEEGSYGLCELCGCRIEKLRLQALPFVKTCIKCQSETESGSRGRVSARRRLWE